MTLALMNNVTAPINQQKSLLKSFISNFTSDEFLSNIVSVALYPADFGKSGSILRSESIVDYLRVFLKDITTIVQQHNFSNQMQIKKQVGVVSSILTIRESSTIVNYENVHRYVNVSDLAAKKIINNAIQNKINSPDEFKEQLNTIINTINAYNEIKSISSNLSLYDYLVDRVDQNTSSIFESIKAYRDLVIRSYNDLSKLQILNKIDKQSDYYILKDEKTTNILSKALVDYISESYSFFRTGYELFDKYVDGFESASIHIVSAPSNHGKSIFLLNLLKNIITYNVADFEEGDGVLLLTLEDNISKVMRRISSIFGNYKHSVIRELYRESNTRIKELKKSGSDARQLKDNIVHIFDCISQKAIANVTQFKTSLVVKYCSENTFSPGDLSKFIDQLKVTEKINVKLVVLDYIDCARPTMDGFKHGDDYSIQGQIVHELRKLSVNLDIPVLTATQNTRSAENLNGEMTNALVGDSYKKVRYTDYLYMSRMCNNKTFLDNDIAFDVIGTQKQNISTQDLAAYESLCNVLIPYEVKITKAKEGSKDKSKYMLFCTENLRIYDSVSEYIRDRKELLTNTKVLEQQIMELNTSSNTIDDNLNFLNPDMY